MDIRIVGWMSGLRKVALTHLLHSALGMTIPAAKALVDLILQLSDFDSGVTDQDQARLVTLREPVRVSIQDHGDSTELKRQLAEMGLVVEDSPSP
jgi:hypothetical protein